MNDRIARTVEGTGLEGGFLMFWAQMEELFHTKEWEYILLIMDNYGSIACKMEQKQFFHFVQSIYHFS